jgi:transcriptional regulator with XRE-family HTH domain
MTGRELKVLIEKTGMTGRQLARQMQLNERTVYNWYSQVKVSAAVLEKISQSTGIDFNAPLTVAEEAQAYGNAHVGETIEQYLATKGIKREHFARQMKVSRTSVYAWFKDKVWPSARLLQAADILGVPVGELKGKGQGTASMERDIYEQLTQINEKLDEILRMQNGDRS